MRLCTIILLFFIASNLFSQDQEKAHDFIREGIKLHDEGKYNDAIRKYEEALEYDKNNLGALAEISISLIAIKNYNLAIKYCKSAIKYHPDSKYLNNVYVHYGTCYDLLKQSKKSIKIYNQGIQKFPDFYLLHFNKGVTLAGMSDRKGSLAAFKKSTKANPTHKSSHYYLGLLETENKNRIPAILALSRFVTLEPTGERAKKAGQIIHQLMNQGVSKREGGGMNISLSPSALDAKGKEDNFGSVELFLSLTAASSADVLQQIADSTGKSTNEIDKFDYQLQMLFNILSEQVENEKGFYWTYYAPYFSDLNEKEYTKVLAYLLHIYSDYDYIESWFKENGEMTKAFTQWSSEYWDR